MTQKLIIDCHAHVIDHVRYPFKPDGRGHKPKAEEGGTREAYAAVLDAHGVNCGLLVQLSGYGFDNSCMLDAMAACPGRFRGIAVVDPEMSDREFDALAAAGVVGLRFNLVTYDPEALAGPAAFRLLERLRERGWFAQVFAADEQWPAAAEALLKSRVRVLVDHFGTRSITGGPAHLPGFQAVLALGRSGRAAVKLSAPFRIAGSNDRAALRPFAEALVAAFGAENCIWGSDWPFVGLDRRLDYAEALNMFETIVPDAGLRDVILRDNPRRLFGFAA